MTTEAVREIAEGRTVSTQVATRRPARVRVRAFRRRAPREVPRVLLLGIVMLPVLRPTGTGNTSPVDLPITLAIATAALVAAARRRPIHLPYALPVGLSVMGALTALLLSPNAKGSVLAVTQDVFLLAWCAVVADVCRKPSGFHRVARTWAVSGAAWAGILIVAYFAHINWLAGVTAREGVRASLTLGDPNVAADYFLVVLFMIRATRQPRTRWIRILACALVITAMFLTGSNGGMLALTLATTVGWVLGLARRRGAVAGLTAAAATAIVVSLIVTHVSLSDISRRAALSAPILRDSIGRQAESDGSRSTLLSESLNLWYTVSPLGVGPGGTKDTLADRQSAYVKEAHDDYMAAMIERGPLGIFALVLLLALVLSRAARGARIEHDELPRSELLVALTLAVMLSGGLYEVLHFRHVWAYYGLVAGVAKWEGR